VTSPPDLFLSERRLLLGPWPAFERDVARLMLANGFEDVRIVGGTRDQGGDILGAQNGQLWVFQCKHTTSGPPPKEAITEVIAAGKYYAADRLVVASSRPPSDSMLAERARQERLGLKVDLVGPAELLKLMHASPEYPRARRKLHEYQEEASSRFREGLVDTGRAQLVMATGLGKTVVMAETVADLLRDGLIEDGRVLVIGHTRDLVDQLHRNFWLQLPKWVPTHHMSDGEFPSYWDGITFATIQSVHSKLAALPKFGLVLIDEAHHVGADIFQRCISHLAPPMLGGVTATPWRGDGYDLDRLLGQPVYKVGIAEGLAKGFLTEVDYRLLGDNLDWEFIQQTSRHKYSIAQLNRKLIIPIRDEIAVRRIKKAFEEERRSSGIVFSPSISHAESFAGMLRRYGFRAEAISSESPPRERDKVLSRFKAGQLDFVTTVDLFNEGMDVPDVDTIVFMRVTHSRRIFVQQLGRGLRTSARKDRVLVLDFVTDLRRVAEVVELDSAVRGQSVERLSLGGRLVDFNDNSAGSFLREWMLDQASLALREGDPTLELPQMNFPNPAKPGGVQ
jgi:superfamily II DNA or RNA helicase